MMMVGRRWFRVVLGAVMVDGGGTKNGMGTAGVVGVVVPEPALNEEEEEEEEYESFSG